MAEYKFQHYVPRTYLESWENCKKQLKLFRKDSNTTFYKATNSIMGKNNYYTITAEDYLIHNDKDSEKFFGDLHDYEITLEEKEINGLKDYAIEYNRFDDWIIKNSDGSTADKDAIKESIRKKRNLEIEIGFHQIESDWKGIREEIVKTITDKSHSLTNEISIRLIEYLISQKSRNDNKKKEYKEIIDTIFGFLKDDLEEKNYDEIFNEQIDAYFKKTLRGYQNGDRNSLISEEEDMLKQLHMVFYRTTGNKTFLTSDNPTFTILDNEFFKGKYNGLYFPINPNILFALYKGDTYSYTIADMPVNMIRRFNKRIKENSIELYVSIDT